MHHMKHELTLCYPGNLLSAEWHARRIYQNELKTFRNFAPNGWSRLKKFGTRAKFKLRGLAGFGGAGLPTELPVEFAYDDSSYKVYAVTLEGHVLVGVRVWTVQPVKGSAPAQVVISTYSWERTALPKDKAAANLLANGGWMQGQQAQIATWEQYLKNIRDFEIRTQGARQIGDMMLTISEQELTDEENPVRPELPPHLQ